MSALRDQEFAAQLQRPRTARAMVPAGSITDQSIGAVAEVFESGVIIDGGNTHYHDDIGHAREPGERGIHHVDRGVSGGVWGFERGFCRMAGGEDDAVQRLYPLLALLAPGLDAAVRTPGREGPASPSEQGFRHCGPMAPGTSSRWSTTGSSTGSWPRTPRG